MPKITSETGHKLIKKNLKILDDLEEKKWKYYEARYQNLCYYLTNPRFGKSLLATLRAVYKFLEEPPPNRKDKNKMLLIEQHRYMFFLCNNHIAVRVRKSASAKTAAHHMNLLCALGLFTKIPQNKSTKKDRDELDRVNDNFIRNNPDKRPINFYSFRLYDSTELKRIEERATRLRQAEVTTTNIDFVYLMNNGDVQDLAAEVFPKNKMSVLDKKDRCFYVLIKTMEELITEQGYCYQSQALRRVHFKHKKLLLQQYATRIKEWYDYHKPTREQKERFGLKDYKYIYTRK